LQFIMTQDPVWFELTQRANLKGQYITEQMGFNGMSLHQPFALLSPVSCDSFPFILKGVKLFGVTFFLKDPNRASLEAQRTDFRNRFLEL